VRIVVVPDAEAVAAAAADRIAAWCDAASGPLDLGCSGGRTPQATYRALRDRGLPWPRLVGWLVDERWVPPGHPESNAAMVRRLLADHVPMRFAAPDTTLPGPAAAAAAYEEWLWSRLGPDPEPHVVLLGVGDDGHTASLFPGGTAAACDRPGYVAEPVPHGGMARLSATGPLLAAARHVLFLATGAGKAAVLRRVLVAEEPLPARRVAEAAAETTWLLDAAAAADLPPQVTSRPT